MALPLFLLLGCVSGYYLPGVSPMSYYEGQPLHVKVNSMSSLKTHVPYDHYHLHYCSNEGRKFPADYDNFGEILYGDVVKPSLYVFQMMRDVKCRLLCEPHHMDHTNKRRFNTFINNRYRAHMLLDNLPVYVDHPSLHQHHVTVGYPLGIPAQPLPALHNHLEFTVRYHKPVLKPGQKHTFVEKTEAWLESVAQEDGGQGPPSHKRAVGRIVGFTVTPHSIDHLPNDCQGHHFSPYAHAQYLRLDPKNESQSVVWSYSVKFVEDTTASWYTRWDVYVRAHENDGRHWVAILNGSVVLLILTGLVAMIIMRTLHIEFNNYNDPENPDEHAEEAAWKLVHGDVFRPPSHPDAFAVCIGTSYQLMCMMIVTLVFALEGLVSPAHRGTVLTAVLVLFALMGVVGGFVTARIAKMFRRQSWRVVFGTGLAFPGFVFGVFFLIDLVMWGEGGANAVPFTSLIFLMALWFLVSLPLVLMGGVVGFRRSAIEPPCDINPVARWVPPQVAYMRPVFTTLVISLLPFGAAFVEIHFLLTSMWLGAYYRVFGFLTLIAIIVAATCIEVSIALVYFMLCYENHRWWWRSFLCCAGAGVHLFTYSVYYFATKMQVTHLWSTLLYFGYMVVMSVAFGMVCGGVGFAGGFWFVRRIYSGIKSV